MTITKTELLEFSYQRLSPILDLPGHLLYSGHQTLKKGDIYLMGFNPGGVDTKPLRERMWDTMSSDHNAYLDECWDNGSGDYEKGKAPLQRRVQWVLENLGSNPRDVCASNLIFARSRDANSISYEFAKVCWPVHEAIIKIVQPKVILAFGNSEISPYGYLKSLLGANNEDSTAAGHGVWKVKAFQAQHRGRSILVAGIPHMSRYNPIGKLDVIQWIRDRISKL